MTHAALKDLLPCPFCGKPANFDAPSELYGSPYFTIRCCVAHSKGYDQQEVGAAWNRRAALSAMEGEAHVEDMVESTDRLTITAPPPQQAVVDRYLSLSMRHLASEDDDGSDCETLWNEMTQDQRDEANRIVSAAINEVAAHPTPSPGSQGGWRNFSEEIGANGEATGYLLFDSTPPAHQPGEVVTDEMVELGLQAAVEASDARLPRYSVIRAIITAALAPKEAGHGS